MNVGGWKKVNKNLGVGEGEKCKVKVAAEWMGCEGAS